MPSGWWPWRPGSGTRTGSTIEVAYLLPWKRALVGRIEARGCRSDVSMVARNGTSGGRCGCGGCWRSGPSTSSTATRRTLPAWPGWWCGRFPAPEATMVATEHLPWSGYALPTRLLNSATFSWTSQGGRSRGVRGFDPAPGTAAARVIVHGLPIWTAWRRRRAPGRRSVGTLGMARTGASRSPWRIFRPQKGYPDLLQAARKVLYATDRVRFLSSVRAPGGGHPRAPRELGLGDRFVLLGYHQESRSGWSRRATCSSWPRTRDCPSR